MALTVGLLAGCSANQQGASPQTAAEAYLSLAARYNRVLSETNVELAQGQIGGAFARLAVAESDFASGLAAIDFPSDAMEPAGRLEAASRALESLYNSATRSTPGGETDPSLLDQISAARETSTQAAADLRAALGLPAP